MTFHDFNTELIRSPGQCVRSFVDTRPPNNNVKYQKFVSMKKRNVKCVRSRCSHGQNLTGQSHRKVALLWARLVTRQLRSRCSAFVIIKTSNTELWLCAAVFNRAIKDSWYETIESGRFA